ncbi:macrolide ABC transporter ATP-binding protein [Vibrio sp. 10N.286.49.C2]|uniref:ABC transporter ATP-binding protein n=1 Tax=unclassified Vibrio TaxID=2614977 RepID=UPI000C8399DA|nr:MULTISPECIES: ABC transporter ATP-binding protein [unclassified Vibrio]PMH39612.1 macrolide ABC transporter ATP-binding protein [Vibrio sp. 10N.286.49.C2]PMH57769.1 macrolide ABC transporter ATP-binding protein [Vibrio sp. 10N.286.49.B1]PMH81406.1 macrolide ABC transporter ATP-binding protein [Vibrio sp. 10N.286.48.B7]
MNAAIRCQHISHSFPTGEERFQVLDDVNFTVQQGEMVAIMGPSGSGKSTLMNMIGCLMTPEDGQVSILNQETQDLNKNQLAEVRRDHIGFVFQQFNLLSRTSALDNVKMPLMYFDKPIKDADNRAKKCLELVGLGDRLHSHPNQLSGGQQQRVAIARALVNQPNILLADEPTGALDSKTGNDIVALFHHLNSQGQTIIIITHDHEVAAQASRILHIRDGKLLSEDALKHLDTLRGSA